jgi:hypothetical protein
MAARPSAAGRLATSAVSREIVAPALNLLDWTTE